MAFLKFLFVILILIPVAIFMLYFIDKLMDLFNTLPKNDIDSEARKRRKVRKDNRAKSNSGIKVRKTKKHKKTRSGRDIDRVSDRRSHDRRK